MGKTAFLFSGQGAQYVGMGRELYENYPAAKEIFDKADELLHFPLSALCFDGPESNLSETENTQPGIYTVSIAALRVLESLGITAQATAGLSLGEYAALTASSALKFEDAVALVKIRGHLMQEAVPADIGGMAAVLGLSEKQVAEACEKASAKGIVEISNLNCPGQIVIGGEKDAVNEASNIAAELGAVRVIALNVSAPFHTSMLKPAAENLESYLNKIKFDNPKIPVVSSVTAKYIADTSEIKPLLTRQVMSTVKWEGCIRLLFADGFDTFVEIGPGKVLSGFVKKIDRSATVCNVEDIKSLRKTLEILG
ncbi:MAG: ACP S-malonyltransferase [Bacillota bacterium]|nr:ACP S-malonyltransferase [Bacillota bacterium]